MTQLFTNEWLHAEEIYKKVLDCPRCVIRIKTFAQPLPYHGNYGINYGLTYDQLDHQLIIHHREEHHE